MERKAHNSLNEAALQVQLGDTTQEPETNEVEMPDMVLEYFNNYFDGDLNEDTSNEDIMQAVYDLIDLAEAVCDAVGIDEAFPRDANYVQPERTTGPGSGLNDMTRAIKDPPAGKSGYLKPSPKQLKKAIAQAADNSPLLITKGRDSFEGKPYTKAIRPSDVQNAAKAKRMTRMKKFKMR